MSDNFCVFNDDSIPFDHSEAERVCRDFLCTVRDMRVRLNIEIIRCKNPEVRLADLRVIESGSRLFSLREYLKSGSRGELKDLWSRFLSLTTTGYLDEVDWSEKIPEDCFDFARRTDAPLLGFGSKGQGVKGLRYLSSPEHVIEEWKYRCSFVDPASFNLFFPKLMWAENNKSIPLKQVDKEFFSRLVEKIFIPLQLMAEKLVQESLSKKFSINYIKNSTGIQNIATESDSVRNNQELAKFRCFSAEGIGTVYFPFHIKERDQNGAIRIYLYWSGKHIYFSLTRHLPTKRY